MAVYADISAMNPDFAGIYSDYRKFMDAQNAWFRIADSSYTRFMESRRQLLVPGVRKRLEMQCPVRDGYIEQRRSKLEE